MRQQFESISRPLEYSHTQQGEANKRQQCIPHLAGCGRIHQPVSSGFQSV